MEDTKIDGLVDYGICCGIFNDITNKIFVNKHTYNDGKLHTYNSDGLCSECFDIFYKIEVQRKINKLEEKLNEQKRCEILKDFDISNTIIES